METHIFITVLICLFAAVHGSNDEIESTAEHRNEKLVSVFQVVKFKNTHCKGSTKNGTCYTSAECSNIGGTSSGSCADGFGVCCIISLTKSGQSSSQNNTYIEMTNSATAGNYNYEICPCSDNICRIKFDFSSFQLAAPNSGFGSVVGYSATALQAAGVGRCLTDQFHITSPSGRASPQICGDNANQHMILDAAGTECMKVHVSLGAGTVTRSLDIRVYQYTCGDMDSGGPPGCLQYYPNESGKIRSFNFPNTTPGAAIAGGYATHLHNQHYKICMRRGLSKEVICYIPCTTIVGASGGSAGNVPTAQPSFGLSQSETAMEAKSVVDTECSNDYIWIRPGTALSTQFTTAISQQDKTAVLANPTRFCGRYFGTTAAGGAFIDASICSYAVPFEVGVEFNDGDNCSANTNQITCESIHEAAAAIAGASGNLGFSLCYIQHTPPI